MTDKHDEAVLGSGSSGSNLSQPTNGAYPPYPAMVTVAGSAYPTTATGGPQHVVQIAYGPVPAPQPCQQQAHSQVHVNTNAPVPRKSYLIAYILWALLGIFGAHHFYLKRYFFGILYLSTFGLYGCGWIIDFFRLPCLVSETNQEQEELFIQYGSTMTSNQINNLYFRRDRSLADAYVLWFPLGIFGFHQYYLGRLGFGVTYSCTFGLGGVGWLVDFFRMPSLVQEANNKLRKIRNGEVVERTLECSVGDAYQLAFPLGFLGLHHFYMGRVGQGLVYLFTLGLAGIGWLVDLVRMPYLVARHNKEVQENHTWLRHLDDAYIYAFPFGILGFHRFYLRGPRMGVLYLFTAGLFGLGWLSDLIRMPWLVKAANEEEAKRQQHLGYNQNRAYLFQPAMRPSYPGHMPSQYGSVYHQPTSPQPPYPTQHGTVSCVSYNNFPNNHCGQNVAAPPPDTQPQNPPPYENIPGSQQSVLPPSYQEAIDSPNQASNPSAPVGSEEKPSF